MRNDTNEKPFRPLVYICSPFSGDVGGNMERTRQFCRFALEHGQIPLAPHLMFPQFVNDEDPEERNLALFMDIGQVPGAVGSRRRDLRRHERGDRDGKAPQTAGTVFQC